MKNFKKISVIGLGYIGLPVASVFANKGLQVVGVDSNNEIVDKINQGVIHIEEPGLQSLLESVVKSKKLKASLLPEEAQAFIIAVPTPFKTIKSQQIIPDTSYVESAIKSIAEVLKKNDLIIIESTCPVGTTERMAKIIKKLRPELNIPYGENYKDTPDINVAYCPERVIPGNVLNELQNNDRVIGGLTEECSNKAVDLYKYILEGGECVTTNSRTAEMVKLTENSSRDVQIAFANELSIICDKANIDVHELIHLSNKHPRVNILNPGPGVGGHCIAVDPWFIISAFPEESTLIKKSRQVNQNKTEWVVNKIREKINELKQNNAKNIVVTFYGLSFKANIDDLRESPAVEIVNKITNFKECVVRCVEPNIDKHESFNLIDLEEGQYGSDINVFLVKHDDFLNKKQYFQNSKITNLDFCGLFM